MGLEIFSLDGRTALVTGASRGIGAAIALAYAEAGADVALAARSTDDIEALAGKIEAAGRRALAITTDVTDPEQIRNCVAQAIGSLGKIDILVNNAGGTRFMAPLIETKPEGWHKAMKLNLDSVFYFSQEVGRHMVERGSGSIINVSSIAGISGAPTLSYYSAAKHAVIGLTKTMAMEVGRSGVRVNAICPGWIKTDLNKAIWSNEEFGAEFVKNTALGRWGEVEEIVGAAIWLGSDASSIVTGSSVLLDAGLTAS